MSKKLLLILALVATLALIVACGTPTPAAPAPTNVPASSSSSASASSSAAAKFTCTDKLGCVDIGPNDPVHIAYAFVTSGDNSTLGLDTKYGAELAIDDAGGKVLGHAIKFDGQDDGCAAEGGQTAATKIASDKTVVAVIGTDCSSAARAAIPILLTQSGLSMISPANTAPDLTDPAKHVAGYFRTAHNDKVQGAVAADFVAKQLKITKAATINDGSIYAQGLAGVFEAQFKADGGTITASEAVNVGDKDMKPVLTRIATGKPDLVYYPIFIAEGGFIASQIRDVPGLEKTAMMGADGIFSPDFLKAGGKNTIGMFWSSPNFSAFGSGYQKLVDAYLKKYNVKGTLAPFHAHSYDAMNMVLAALQKPNVVAKDADGTLHVQKQALRDAIAATKNFQGITGNLTCDPNGDCADPKIAVYQASADDFNGGTMPKLPVWAPGGADYKAPGTASSSASSAASSVASSTASTAPVKFGIVLVGPYNDHGWSEAHYMAANYVKSKIPGSDFIYLDKLNSADRPGTTLEQVVTDMASKGVKLIITTSDDFQTDTITAAQKHPELTFINASGDSAWKDGKNYKAIPNLGNFMGKMEYMKMVAGCSAALTTQTGKIGFLGPLINDETRRLADSAYLGAQYCWTNYAKKNAADLKFDVTWIGFWFNIPGVTLDPTKVATDFYNSGHDVVISGIDTTEALIVAGQRQKQGQKVWALSYDYINGCDEAPDACLGVPYFNWGPRYVKTVQAFAAGKLTADWQWDAPDWSNLANPDTGAVGFTFGKGLSDANKTTVQTFIKGLGDGSINLFKGPITLQDGTAYLSAGATATNQQIWYLPQLLQGMTGQSVQK